MEMEMDVCLDSYDVDAAASFLRQAIMSTIDNKIYSDLMQITWVCHIPFIEQKGIFKCYDIKVHEWILISHSGT